MNMRKLLSAIDKVQLIAETTITTPVLNVPKEAAPSMIGKYFKTVEEEFAVARHISSKTTATKNTHLAERVISKMTREADNLAPAPMPRKEEPSGEDNFTARDLDKLMLIPDLDRVKARAIELVSKTGKRSMKPEKIEFFKHNIMQKKDKVSIIRLMYDLLLAGEGHKVIGTKRSMAKNSYQQRFEGIEDGTDTITVDVPLFIRLMEYAREDAQDDADLHSLTEKLVSMSNGGQALTMDQYDSIVGDSTDDSIESEPDLKATEDVAMHSGLSKAEYLAKRKALQNVQMSLQPNEDPELQQQVMIRLAKLRKEAKAAGLIPEMESAAQKVPQKPRQGPLRTQTGAGHHTDKTKTIPRKEKHKQPAMEAKKK